LARRGPFRPLARGWLYSMRLGIIRRKCHNQVSWRFIQMGCQHEVCWKLCLLFAIFCLLCVAVLFAGSFVILILRRFHAWTFRLAGCPSGTDQKGSTDSRQLRPSRNPNTWLLPRKTIIESIQRNNGWSSWDVLVEYGWSDALSVSGRLDEIDSQIGRSWVCFTYFYFVVYCYYLFKSISTIFNIF
jgi:hypothetical protein